MNNFFVRSWRSLALRGAAGIAFGVLALLWPGITLLSLVVLFAVYALAAGLASLSGAIRHRRTDDDWWLALLLGAVSIVAGVAAVLNPALTALVLVLLMGANALVTGVLDIVAAIRLRKAIEGEWLLGVAGIVSILFGALVLLHPGAGAVALILMVSLYGFVSGVLLLAQALRMRALAHAGRAPQQPERRVLPDRRIAPGH